MASNEWIFWWAMTDLKFKLVEGLPAWLNLAQNDGILAQSEALSQQGKDQEALNLLSPFRSQSFTAKALGSKFKARLEEQNAFFSLNIIQAFYPESPTGSEFTEALHNLLTSLREQKKLRLAFARLSPKDREEIRLKVGPSHLAEIFSFSENSSVEFFFEEATHFAIRLKQNDELNAAGGILSFIAHSKEIVAEEQKKNAELELHAIEGKGEIGRRLEFLAGRLSKEVSDYRTIVPMLGASIIGQVVNTAALGRFAGMSTHYLTRGWEARLLAGSLGFLAEASTFTLASRAFSYSSSEPISEDFERATLTVSALRLFGFLGNQAFLKVHGFSEFGIPTQLTSLTRFTQIAFPQAAMFMGMLASHALEEAVKLKPHVDGATTMTDTLASMLSMQMGSHLGHSVLGRNFAEFQKEMAMRTDLVGARFIEPFSRKANDFDSDAEGGSCASPEGSMNRAPTAVGNLLFAPFRNYLGAGGMVGSGKSAHVATLFGFGELLKLDSSTLGITALGTGLLAVAGIAAYKLIKHRSSEKTSKFSKSLQGESSETSKTKIVTVPVQQTGGKEVTPLEPPKVERWREAKNQAILRNLRESIAKNPDDQEAREVLMDHLQEMGHPFGEMIALDKAFERARVEAPNDFDNRSNLLEELNAKRKIFEEKILKRIQRNLSLESPPHIEWSWENGFISDFKMARTSVSLFETLMKSEGGILMSRASFALVDNLVNLRTILDSPHFQNIHTLSLNYSSLHPKGLGAFFQSLNATKVTHLNLGDNYFEDGAMGALANLLKDSHISSLSLSGNLLNGEDVRTLTSSLPESNLTALYLLGTRIDDEAVDLLANSLHGTKITTLDLGFNDISDYSARELLESDNLESVFLTGTLVSTLLLEAIAKKCRENRERKIAASPGPLLSAMPLFGLGEILGVDIPNLDAALIKTGIGLAAAYLAYKAVKKYGRSAWKALKGLRIPEKNEPAKNAPMDAPERKEISDAQLHGEIEKVLRQARSPEENRLALESLAIRFRGRNFQPILDAMQDLELQPESKLLSLGYFTLNKRFSDFPTLLAQIQASAATAMAKSFVLRDIGDSPQFNDFGLLLSAARQLEISPKQIVGIFLEIARDPKLERFPSREKSLQDAMLSGLYHEDLELRDAFLLRTSEVVKNPASPGWLRGLFIRGCLEALKAKNQAIRATALEALQAIAGEESLPWGLSEEIRTTLGSKDFPG